MFSIISKSTLFLLKLDLNYNLPNFRHVSNTSGMRTMGKVTNLTWLSDPTLSPTWSHNWSFVITTIRGKKWIVAWSRFLTDRWSRWSHWQAAGQSATGRIFNFIVIPFHVINWYSTDHLNWISASQHGCHAPAHRCYIEACRVIFFNLLCGNED